MGLDYTVHVGPYVQCKISKVDSDESKFSCPNKDCSEYNRFFPDAKKFCSQCGSKITKVISKKKTSNVDRWEVMAKIKEKLVPVFGGEEYMDKNNVHFWVSNIRYLSREDSFDPTEKGFVYLPIASIDTIEEIDKFKEKFANELKVLEEFYESHNVTVKWGVFSAIH